MLSPACSQSRYYNIIMVSEHLVLLSCRFFFFFAFTTSHFSSNFYKSSPSPDLFGRRTTSDRLAVSPRLFLPRSPSPFLPPCSLTPPRYRQTTPYPRLLFTVSLFDVLSSRRIFPPEPLSLLNAFPLVWFSVPACIRSLSISYRYRFHNTSVGKYSIFNRY